MQLATCSCWLGAFAGIVIALAAAPVGAVETLTGGAASICREGKVEMIIGGARAASTCVGPTRAAAPAANRPAMNSMRISDTEQRQRDQDRRAILESELQRERETLAGQLRPGSGVDEAAINRTRSNLAALQRELGRNDL